GCLLYIIICITLGFQLSLPITETMQLGKKSVLPFRWLLPLLAIDSLTLLFRGFLDTDEEAGISRGILLLRQAATLLFVSIFARIFHDDGAHVSKLFMNREVEYVYGAAGVAVGYLLGAAVGLILYIMFYFKALHRMQSSVNADRISKRENSNAIMGNNALIISLAFAGMYGMHFLAQLLAMRMYRNEGMLAGSYQWGIYSGVCCTISVIPVLLVILIHMGSSRQLALGMRQGDAHEVRIKCQGLSDVSMLLTFFFMAFHFAAAKSIAIGLFGTESALAVRLIRYSSVAIVFTVYALNTSLELFFMQKRSELVLHALAALIAGGVVTGLLISPQRLGIYAVILGKTVFALVLSMTNQVTLIRKLRLRPDWQGTFLWPFVYGLISGAVALLLTLLLGLFLPHLVVVILVFPISFLICFAIACIRGGITVYALSSLPLGDFFIQLGRMLTVLR
ncbi:MAG: hypothetical protein IJ600_08615, partial [Lachnospiraceae bacterium]|nr:hypothetical protein [Lachnospiraceae bacterium]